MSLDPSTQVYIDAMVDKPPQAAINIIDAAIVGLKSAGIWPKTTWLSFLAGNTQQATLLNAVNPAQTLTAVNSPSFIAYQGWQGVIANSAYLEGPEYSTILGATQGFVYASITGGTDAQSNATVIGHKNGTGNRVRIIPRAASNTIRGAIWSASTNYVSPAGASTTIIGDYLHVLETDSTLSMYKNGSFLNNQAVSVTVGTSVMALFTSLGSYNDFKCPIVAVGDQSLTAQEAEDLHEISRAFVRDMARVPMRHSGVMSVAHGLMMASGAPFPFVKAQQSGKRATNSASNVIPIPSGKSAGDLLVVVCGGGSAGAGSTITTVPAGWTLLTPALGTGFMQWLAVIYKISDGTETSVTLTATGNHYSAWNSYVIGGAKKIESTTIALGTSGKPQSASLSPSWGNKKTLWITAMSQLTIDTNGAQTAPSGYSDFGQEFNTLSGVDTPRVAWAIKQKQSSSESPPSFGTDIVASGNRGWGAITIGISG